MIPKIIHYVWVGDNPKSELVLKCIDSWKKFCPDYEIIEWNNDSLKEIDNLYVNQAFECKKWAFVSDYLRLYALKKHGGFYFDTDLEITNNLDEFLNNDFVTGFENFNGKISPIITALIGSEKGNSIICELLNEYNNISFIKDGNMDLTTNVSRITKLFNKKFNLKKPYNPNKEFLLQDKCVIYPAHYFCLKEEGKENYSIHHYDGSWVDGYSRKNISKFGQYRLVRFHKRKHINNDTIPLLKGENIVKTLNIFSYKICLIKMS